MWFSLGFAASLLAASGFAASCSLLCACASVEMTGKAVRAMAERSMRALLRCFSRGESRVRNDPRRTAHGVAGALMLSAYAVSIAVSIVAVAVCGICGAVKCGIPAAPPPPPDGVVCHGSWELQMHNLDEIGYWIGRGNMK